MFIYYEQLFDKTNGFNNYNNRPNHKASILIHIA